MDLRRRSSSRPSAGITRIRFKGSMATKPSSQPGPIPSSPLWRQDRNLLFKNWALTVKAGCLSGFFEEVARPIGPSTLLGSRAKVSFELHTDLQILRS
jgi:hypothetical protein